MTVLSMTHYIFKQSHQTYNNEYQAEIVMDFHEIYFNCLSYERYKKSILDNTEH